MVPLRDLLSTSIDQLRRAAIPFAKREAETLILETLQQPRSTLYLEPDLPIDPLSLQQIQEKISRRALGEPIAYIQGQQLFLGSSFKITPAVLIPRQETEILAAIVIEQLRQIASPGETLWDIGSGSGCLAISIKKALPHLQVIASDISQEALDLAKENSLANGVDVTFLLGDLFTPFAGKRTEYLLSNPPYIALAERAELEREVIDYEPHLALFGGVDGWEFYQRYAETLADFLKPGGRAWFEIGATQGEKILSLFHGSPWKRKAIQKDWSGKNRFFFLEKE